MPDPSAPRVSAHPITMVAAFFRGPAAQFWLLGLYSAAAIVETIQRGVFAFPNDFAIFRAAFWNLVAGRNLYVLRLEQAHDLFWYSPSFALLFAPFAVLPFVVGLFVWNLFNAIALFFALRLLLPPERAGIAQALVFLPMLRSMQSSQSNALLAALIILAFVCYERGWLWRGGIAIAVGAVTKVFPLAALTFALPRPDRVRAVVRFAAAMVVLLTLPLLVISPEALAAQYQSWRALGTVESSLLGSSLMGLLRNAGLSWPFWPIQLLAAAIVIAVLFAKMRGWHDRSVRLRFLAFIMVFCVVFNHRAERQASVIAISGMVIWYLASPHETWRTSLFAIVYFLVAITGADIIPHVIKRLLVPQVRFAIPLTILWLVILGDLTLARGPRRSVESG